MKTVWIDIDNSPHVPFFAPIISDLQENGIDVVVTARDFAQTIPLLEQYAIQYVRVDGHGGANKFRKVASTLHRAARLTSALRSRPIDIMVNHGARAGIVAAKLLRVPVISGFDYEHTELRILFALSDLVLAPEALRERYKHNKKVRFYPGLKEEVYLCEDEPRAPIPHADSALPLPNGRPFVVLRPPSFVANYHSSESEAIFTEVLKLLVATDCTVVFIPRTSEDRNHVEKVIGQTRTKGEFVTIKGPVSGRDLIAKADLVISGGGTMLREAAILGTPAYSIFCSQPPSIDLKLQTEGKLQFIRESNDLKMLKITKKTKSASNFPLSRRTRDFIVQTIISQIC